MSTPPSSDAASGQLYTPEAGVAAVHPDRLEARLGDRKPLLSAAEAVAEAHRCLYCHDAPCIKACPTAIDIPTFIRKIGTGNVEGSARVILDSNILGLSCARVCPTEVLCEGDCVYTAWGQKPIMIGKLQRVATEYAYDRELRFFERGEANGHRVALVGAGPASLACAHELARLGYACTIFEGRSMPGGLNSNGVAPYKLQLSDAVREINYVLGIGGIEVRTGVQVGTDVTFEQLAADYDAVFLGIGLGPDGWLEVPGEELEGVSGAVAFIERLKTSGDLSLDGIGRAVVLGGGNTAIDCVRELVGLGVPEVTMVYRRDAAAMSGYTHEWNHAKIEGGRAVYWAQPIELVGEAGKVRAVRCARTRPSEADAAGRRGVVVDVAETFEIPADLVLMAVGQGKLGSLVAGIEGITLDRGRIVVDPVTGQTGNPAFFAGGDCANGGKEVVNAAAEGKRAAQGIHAVIQSRHA